MRILVTGGAGFIGSHLVERLLAKNNEVIVIDNFNDTYDPLQKRNNIKKVEHHNNYQLYEIDLRNKEDVWEVFQKEKQIDYVLHLAGVGGVRPSQDNPQFYYEENVMATINVVEAMKKYDCKNLIYYSSSSVYGNNNHDVFKEYDDTNTPISIYAATKKSSEIMLYPYYVNYHFNIIILRPFTVYGPRQRPDLAIHLFTQKILHHEPITIFGDGSMVRDYTYVSDMVDATVKAIDYMKKKKTLYQIINIASSSPKSIHEMVHIIEEVVGEKAMIQYQDKPMGDVNKTFGNISLAKELLKWEPKVSFKDGIMKFIDWYKKNE